MILFTVYGKIKGKGRPRSYRMKNGAIGTYTPQETVAFEDSIRAVAAQYRPQYVLDGPLHMQLNCYFLIPKTKVKKNKAVQQRYNTSKPDIDNVFKAVADALNGLIYRDDKQIVAAIITKEYVETVERIEVTITPIGD